MMKINKYLVTLALAFCILQGCKEDTVTETENNNNNQTPNAPELTSPANNSTIIDISPEISWVSYSGAVSYRVQVSLDANFIGILRIDTNISGIGLNISQGILTTNTYYYWRVMANLQSGTSNWSAVWRFTIILAPPAPPNLISPPNNSSGQSFTPLFDWDDPATAETYRIQVSPNSNFAYVVFDSSGVIVSVLQCPPLVLITNTQYFWRVNASNSNGASTSNWSTVFNFTTIQGPLPNSINGTITFADTIFLQPPNMYMIAAFMTNTWPPTNHIPVSYDTLDIKLIGNVYRADYTLRNILDGTYYVTSYLSEKQLALNIYLGIYGCDTVHIPFSNCPLNPTGVTISNNFGVNNINFLSWADTTKAIF